jgi:ABC-type spermidine/putrescine transport system permease subunit I
VTSVAVPARAEARRRLASGGPYAVVASPFLLLATLYLVPAGILAVYSLWRIGDDYQMHATWTLEQYEAILHSDVALRLLGRTFAVALGNTAVCLVVAFPLAYFLARMLRSKWRNLLLVLLIAPSWTSHLIRVYAWMLILGNAGLVNYAARNAGLPGTPYESLIFNRFSLMVALVYVYLPFMLLPIYASLEKIDQAQVEAARSLGAPGWRVFLRVVVPLARPGIVAGCMLTFIPTLGEYVAAALLGGRSGYMYGNYVADKFTIFDWPAGSALGMVLLVAALLLVAAFSRLVRLRDVWAG